MVKVTPFGAIPIKNGEKEILNLTGSATRYEVGGLKILIDLGMFQGTEGSDEFNKEHVDFLKDIDVVIVTHPHMDHVGRLPLLPKYGYKGPIYMTSATKEITFEMLLDSLKIQQQDKIESMSKNKHLGNRLRDALKILTYFEELKKNHLSPDEKNKRTTYLEKKLGKEYKTSEIKAELEDYLGFYGVKTEADIEKVLTKMKQTLFELEDIIKTMDQVRTIDLYEEKILSSREIKVENDNHQESEILENLPKRVAEGFDQTIEVTSKRSKVELKALWESQLREEIEKVKKSGVNLNEYKQDFKKTCESYLAYLKQYSFLDQEQNKTSPGYINQLHLENKDEYKGIKKQMKAYKKFLETHNISNTEDIALLTESDEKIIELLKIEIPFNSSDIEKALKLIEIKKEKSPREVVGITAVNAAHVVGSTSIQIISGTVQKQVKNLMEINGNGFCAHFSGDLGRMHDNRLGKPDIPLHPVDYLQIESTYGGRNHRNKAESIKELIDSIDQSEGDVLIAAFSQQRKQEILITIIEELIKKGSDALDYEILIDAPLAERLTNIYFKYEGKIFDLLKDETQEQIFGKVIFRYLKEGEFEEIHVRNNQEVDLKKLAKLDINNPAFQYFTKDQKNILKKLIENVLEVDSSENIRILREFLGFKLFNKQVLGNKKAIIIASSGMMDGGAIMNHLPYILADRNATLLAPGYVSPGTIGNDIVIQKAKHVTINGQKIEVVCVAKFIDGFSSHIGHNEILEYITQTIKEGKFKKDAILALTHGSIKGQTLLQSDIEEILKGFGREDVKVIIPSFGDAILLGEKEIIKQVKPKASPAKKILITPKYLLREPGEESKEVEKNGSNKTVNIELLKGINSESLREISDVVHKKIVYLEESIQKAYLSYINESLKNNQLNSPLQKLSQLSGEQRGILNDYVERKITRTRQVKNEIAQLSGKIRNIQEITEQLRQFIYTDSRLLKDRIISFNSEIEQLTQLKLDIQESISSEKSTGNSEKLTEYEIELKKTTKNIEKVENRIRDINKNIIALKINFKRTLKSLVPSEIFEKLSEAYDSIWKNQEVFESFITQLQKVIPIYKGNITILEGEQNSHITLQLEKGKLHFGGRNILDEIFSGEKFNDKKLQEYLNNNFFEESDQQYFTSLLGEYNKKIPDKEKIKIIKSIKKKLKEKINQNKDLGIDITINFSELEKNILHALKQIFEKDYFENYIVPNFNIYLFFKSGVGIQEYITNKYNISQIKNSSNLTNYLTETINDLEYYLTLLQKIENLNVSIKEVELLKEIEFGIELTRKEVDTILSKF